MGICTSDSHPTAIAGAQLVILFRQACDFCLQLGHKILVGSFCHLYLHVCRFSGRNPKLHSHNTILQEGQPLILWILPAAFALAGVVAILAALRIRHRRNNRLQLRLLAGRRRLLGEEIDTRSRRLDELDPEELAAQQNVADVALDGLHMDLLKREAQLQNLQELAHLQQHKLAVLQRRREELIPADSATTGQLTPQPESQQSSR